MRTLIGALVGVWVVLTVVAYSFVLPDSRGDEALVLAYLEVGPEDPGPAGALVRSYFGDYRERTGRDHPHHAQVIAMNDESRREVVAAFGQWFARTQPAHLPPIETFNAALKSLGHSINTRDSAARARARELVSRLNSVPLTQARLAIGAPRPDWTFTPPAEGAELWEGCFCIPAGSAQPDLAHDFIRLSLSAHPPNTIPATDVPLEMLSPFAPQI